MARSASRTRAPDGRVWPRSLTKMRISPGISALAKGDDRRAESQAGGGSGDSPGGRRLDSGRFVPRPSGTAPRAFGIR
jgi:hypothetical protein